MLAVPDATRSSPIVERILSRSALRVCPLPGRPPAPLASSNSVRAKPSSRSSSAVMRCGSYRSASCGPRRTWSRRLPTARCRRPSRVCSASSGELGSSGRRRCGTLWYHDQRIPLLHVRPGTGSTDSIWQLPTAHRLYQITRRGIGRSALAQYPPYGKTPHFHVVHPEELQDVKAKPPVDAYGDSYRHTRGKREHGSRRPTRPAQGTVRDTRAGAPRAISPRS